MGQARAIITWISRPGELVKSKSAYEHPQPHACFIQSVADDLVNEGGIMDLWVREARLFKYGSGTGSNFSALRGENEKLSGGGRSSGLMSFLKIGDRAAGAIKSGGTTRRAAKMVVVDADHPDIEAYIGWKVKEEQKVAALAAGSKLVKKHLKAILKACVNCEGPGDDCFSIEKNPALKREVKLAHRADVPDGIIKRTIQLAREGRTTLDFDTYDTDWESEAYLTVSGQNSNNSVRVTDAFLRAVEADGEWSLTRRLDGKASKTMKARELWEKIGYAAWASADPGLQYHTTINDWHTCPDSGPIRASNPCSEYMFLDDTACNLASLNLLQFLNSQTKAFDVTAYEHAVRLWTLTLEISVAMAQFPSKEIARLSYDYRTLGLGYANIGGLLMTCGIPYDSDEGRAICAALSAILTGRAYAASAEMAARSGPFPGHKPMRRRCCASSATTSAPPTARSRATRACPRRRPRSTMRSLRRPARRGRASRAPRAMRGRPRSTLGREARLPQRAGLRGRADRHHRPRDGLRHDRHRARLRAGEVQEARGRRLFQDHQPRRPRRSARARLWREGDRGNGRLCGRPRNARACARDQPRGAQGQGPAGRGDRQGRGGAARRLRHPLRLQQVDARR